MDVRAEQHEQAAADAESDAAASHGDRFHGRHRARRDDAAEQAHIADFGYTPNRMQIKAGDTINFVNNGPTFHTATATDGTGWDTGLLNSGESASFTFDTPGTYYYTCTPHPFMVGQILVAGADGKVPDATPATDQALPHP